MRNWKLLLEYEGTAYSGWQWQPRGRTVQAVLEEALERLLGNSTRVIGAGRTDAGVHARGQVASFRTSRGLGTVSIQRGLNALLPRDIRVRGCEEVDETFDARKSALWRRYAYFLVSRSIAVGRAYAVELRHPVSFDRLQEAAAGIIGEHDFSSFCKAKAETDNRFCRVEKSAWEKRDDGLIYEIVANRFLQHMVRSLVGTMLYVGRGKISLSEWGEIIRARDRRAAGPTAPSKGLFLEEVYYPE